MNSQEIFENITKEEWTVFDKQFPIGTLSINTDVNTRIATIEFEDVTQMDNAQANAEAIVSAVNNTFGKGIDPVAVPEMMEALKKFLIDDGKLNISERQARAIYAKTVIKLASLEE